MSREEKSSSDGLSVPLAPVLRRVHLGDVIELFQDPETERASEGYAKVWAIQSEDEAFYELVVSFMDDPKAPSRKFIRKYRKTR